MPDGFAENDAEAAQRAHQYRNDDPCPHIPRALLSREHIMEYVRATGMLFPFYPDEARLKSASYEANPKLFIRWDSKERKIVTDVSNGPAKAEYDSLGYELPANSITFMQIESTIRLPDYIALRFNLRIKHVHRGLLLGTGPLVDPGFHGNLLIPLHNLTSEPYRIDGGIIWIEFTKTSGSSIPSKDFSHKTNVAPEVYFERANKNNPIQSSIPKAILQAESLAKKAQDNAKKAARTNLFFAGLGFLTILGLIFTAMSFGFDVLKIAKDAEQQAHNAESEVQSGIKQNASSQELENLNDQVRRLSLEVKALSSQQHK